MDMACPYIIELRISALQIKDFCVSLGLVANEYGTL